MLDCDGQCDRTNSEITEINNVRLYILNNKNYYIK